ncbi:uncharacterized protein LOC128174859 [Crassostrea angulata]|uniref:uncharacterized protein LOC128174859 n=1 Tax=Magallana angulata TaxID=2784310 RepID=UPI0022B0D823|nr:uncharacterized protein LOC128174859 [Crassostrea angulata]
MDYRCILMAIMYFIIIHKAEQYEYLALGKTGTVSQRYNNKDFDPSLAVDGDHSTDLLKCSLTASGQKEAWLTVDLGEKKNIASFSLIHGGFETDPNDSGWLCRSHFTAYDAQVVCLIWGFLPDNGVIGWTGTTSSSFSSRNYECVGNETSIHDCPNNDKKCTSDTQFLPRTTLSCKKGNTLSGFSVYVSDTTDWRLGNLCYQHDIEQPLNNTVTIDCFTSGRYVTIYNSRKNTDASFVSEFAYINICELNITGCNIGFYGENCTKCPANCLNDTCQFQIGHCFNCKDGFNGEMCEEEYPSTLYGTHCNTTCSEYCQNRICNHINGYCLECIEARIGNFCENILAAQAAFPIVSFLIATTSILFVLVVVLTFFTLKRKCMSLRKTSKLDYDVSDVKTIDRKYETLQRKTVAENAGTDTTAEYMEISAITSDIN